MQKSLDYVQMFSKFKNKETIKDLTKLFPTNKENPNQTQFHPFEVTQIINLCPETVEDAKGWIPRYSIDGF
jgi:DNA-directed RNA polymerase II subunit RPB4